MSSDRKIMNGDYYEISQNSYYQKHLDVAVHCHGNEKLQNGQNQP